MHWKNRIQTIYSLVTGISKASDEDNGAAYESYWSARKFASEQEAKDAFVRSIEHSNKQHGGLFGVSDPKEELKLVKFVKVGNSWKIKSKFPKKRVKKVYEYTTNKDLAADQRDNYVSNIGHAFDMLFSKVVDVDVKEIHPTETVSDGNVRKIMEAIKEGEDLPPLLLDGGYGVIDGHHRLEAAKRLKIKKVPAIFYYNPDEDEISELK